MVIKPDMVLDHGSKGIQKIYRFKNLRGASVVKNERTYGGSSGLWEIAAIKFKDDKNINNWDFDENTKLPGFSGGIRGWASDDTVEKALTLIKNAKPYKSKTSGRK